MVEISGDEKSRKKFKILRIITGMEPVLIIIILIIFDRFSLNFNQISPWIFGILMPLSYIWPFLAKRKAAYPHSFRKHPVCYLGQIQVFGKDNHQAVLWVQGFFIGLGTNFIIAGAILRKYFQFNPYLQFTAWILYFCALLVVFMGIIPLDLYRNIHLAVTFSLFTLHYAVNIILISYFTYMRHYGVIVHFIVYLGCTLHLTGATLYLIAYAVQKKASLFQNGWFLGTFIGLWAVIAGMLEISSTIS